jgi:RHS repeat-associated protein
VGILNTQSDNFILPLQRSGNRKTRTDKRLGTTLTYAYDNIYQLLTAKQGTTTKESYTGACPERYSSREAMRVSRRNPVGNRLSSVGVSPYSYNSSNQLTSIPGTTYTYDNNGNTKTKTTAAGTTTYTWDYDNRLTQVALPGTAGTVTFKYDPFGRRVQKAFTQGGNTTTTNYLYDGPNLIEEMDNAGNVLARYANQMRVDEPLTELRSGTTSYYQQDGLGSVTSLSNGAGMLANTYTFDSYGKLNTSTGTLTNPFQYTGRESDQETGLYYYRARYYDPTIGRFTSEDPIGLQGGPNFYDYVGNDPVDFNDPRGLAPTWRPPYRWRYCTGAEISECTRMCKAGGKEFESCRVSQTYRIIQLVNGPEWTDGPLSCSCKDPNEKACKTKIREWLGDRWLEFQYYMSHPHNQPGFPPPPPPPYWAVP